MSESHDRQLMPGWPVPLREATPYGQAPKYLICDHDSKYGSCFRRVARTSGIKLLKTPVHAPRANAVCERFLRSVRQECLDRLLILQEKQLHRVRKRVCGLRAIRHGRIKGLGSRYQNQADQLIPLITQARG